MALSYASSLLAGSPSLPRPNDGKQAKREPIPVRITGVGQARFAGATMLYEEKDGVAYVVNALHDGKITSIEQIYLNDDLVTLTDGIVDEGSDGRYGQDKIRITTRLGLATETAHAAIVSALSPIWSNNHRGDGIASLGMICGKVAAEDYSRIYPNQLPQPSVVMKMSACWDPRDSAQAYDDPDTWTWTENPALQLLFYLTSPLGKGEDVVTRILPELDSWKRAANICDEEVALKGGGTEPRYRAGGIWQHNNNPSDVIGTILATFDGWMGETGTGAFKVFAGQYYPPTVSIAANHITGFHVQRFTPDESAVNEIAFSYTSRAHKWAEVQGQSWRDEADISARGKTRTITSNLTWVFSHSQCRRLAKREMHRATSSARGSVRTDLAGFQALGERYIALTLPDIPSLGTFAAQVSNVQIDCENNALSFDWVMVDETIDDWDEDAEEGDPPPELDEVISTGSNSAVTAAPTDVEATGGVGEATITWRNPNSFNFAGAVVLRAASTDDFEDATVVSGGSALAGGLGAMMEFTDTPVSAGSYKYWVVAVTSALQQSSPGGPDTATVT